MASACYQTIVADPPWSGNWWAGSSRRAGKSSGSRRVYGAGQAAYPLMSVREIIRLPVRDWIAPNAHLYLWIPDSHLIEGSGRIVAKAWGFNPQRLIIWHKANPGNGRFPRPAHETILVARRGTLPFTETEAHSVQRWKQVYVDGAKQHSAKPDGFLDLVERASPGPYLELFARRARMGWDYWGDESLGTADLPKEAA